jgi:hypothetical protein
MAKAIITLEDEEGGGIHVTAEFDPPYGHQESNAQLAAGEILDVAMAGQTPGTLRAEYADGTVKTDLPGDEDESTRS